MRQAIVRTLVSSFLVAAAAAGCSTDGDDPFDGDPAPTARATWHQDVAPIVYEKCVTCHVAGGIAPFALTSYIDAQPAASLMVTMVETGKMPPWSAVESDDCAPRHSWKDDPRLTSAELDTLRAWVEDGAVEGDPDDAAPLPEPPSFELENVTDEIAPSVTFTPSGFTDQMVCFVLEPNITELQWMTGLEFVPSNLEVAHHAVLTAIPPESANIARAMVGPDGTFSCTGGISIPGAYGLGVWVPGARPFEAPTGTGTPLAAGTVMVMQMHYHPFGNDHDPDRTEVKLRLTPTAPGKTFLQTAIGNVEIAPILQPGPNDPIGGVEFLIPPGDDQHTETMVFTINNPENPARVPMVSIFPHMHYVGVDLSLKITRANPNPGEPSEECLFNTPNWDFDWQRTYEYDVARDDMPTVGHGDVLTISCRYDNTMANPFVRRMMLEEQLDGPIEVELGEETTNEMCLTGIGLIF